MSTPPEKLAESIGHDCQNGHGVRADVVLVQLATGECDILCQPCLVGLMAAVIEQVTSTVGDDQDQAAGDAAAIAAEAAAAALAAD